MPSVLLAGAFGQRNPGDDALLDAFVRELPGWRCVATSREPARTSARHGVAAVQSRDPRRVLGALRHADALLLAGGTVFKTLGGDVAGRGTQAGDARGRRLRTARRLDRADGARHPHALLRNALALTTAARLLGRRVALLGVGAGRLDDPGARLLARLLVRSADLLVLRDEESAATLGAIGAPTPFRVGADAAWPLVGAPQPDAGAARRDGAIVVAVGRHGGEAALAGRLAEALALVAAVRPAPLVRVQPWQVGDTGEDTTGLDDESHAHLLATALRRRGLAAEVVPPPATLLDARDLVAGARLVIATRFHATVAAAAAGVPFLAVAHEQKLAGLARRLGQPAVAADAAAPQLAAAVADALERRPAPRAAVEAEVAAARDGFRLLRLLLTGGAAAEGDDVGALPLAPARWAA
jgi:polysaccharide pyruvyl transferase WcaK-like protein